MRPRMDCWATRELRECAGRRSLILWGVRGADEQEKPPGGDTVGHPERSKASA